VREAAKRGAQIILIQELFETPYFCIEQDSRHLRCATTVADNRAITHFAPVARELGVVLPISFFEKANNSYLQFDRDPRRRRHQPRRVSQGAHPERPGLPGEELLQSRRHRFQGVRHEVRAHRRRHLLGPVVPGDARARWR
jgi:hypothetical protein